MKFYLVLLLAVAITGVNMSQSKLKKEDLKTNKDKISYSIGINIGKNMKTQQIDVDAEILSQGLKDALSTDTTVKPILTEGEMNQVMNAFQQEIQAKQSEKQKESSGKNKAEGEKFLAENKTKEGVVVLPSGLQYKVIKAGTGKSPKAEDKVTVHYTGTLIDGTVFDSSVERNEPISFPVNGVIKGWTEALQLMKEGDKWELYIPSELGYGEAGAGGQIGPNAVLVFTVELIKVN